MATLRLITIVAEAEVSDRLLRSTPSSTRQEVGA